jgi:hypothetical protein
VDEYVVTNYNFDGRVISKVWYKWGVVHRDDGPAIIEYWSNGYPNSLYWVLYGKAHRDDGPAHIVIKNSHVEGHYFEELYYLAGLIIWHSYSMNAQALQPFKTCNRSTLIMNIKHSNEHVSSFCKLRLKHEEF